MGTGPKAGRRRMKEFVNNTDCDLAAQWIGEKLAAYDTSLLRLHLKRHRRRDQLFSGYCRYDDFLIMAAIHEHMPLPFLLQKPVGSKPNLRKRVGYDYVWHEAPVRTANEAMVWVVGHECWHFFCKTKQHKGNWETRANKFGFEWLAEYAAASTPRQRLFDWMPARVGPASRKLKVIYG